MSDGIPIQVKSHIQEDDIHPYKIRYSNYLITINTNKSFSVKHPQRQYYIQRLHKTMDIMSKNLKKYFDIQDEWDKNWIKNISFNYTIEIGRQKKMLHTHLNLKIHHYSYITLRGDKMKRDFEKLMDLKSSYFNSKIIKTGGSIEKYLLK